MKKISFTTEAAAALVPGLCEQGAAMTPKQVRRLAPIFSELENGNLTIEVEDSDYDMLVGLLKQATGDDNHGKGGVFSAMLKGGRSTYLELCDVFNLGA